MQRKIRREVSTYTMKLVLVVVIALVFSCSALANGNVESKASPVELEEQLGDIAAKESRYFLSALEFVEDSSGVSPCAIAPCKNGGTCQPIAGDDFTCQCTEGFYGDNCEKDVNQCLTSKPCLNGATCVNKPGSYSCTCPQGHTGKNCEKGK
ncbi:versican core protein-like [Orbicella faveolata]|uniref:versican core protein-like n=1 Tax=Orbicella faveolata TaxID=48498 RepID=UPI0009E39D98|nr:versican core protein-like [Orbicella faveolata]